MINPIETTYIKLSQITLETNRSTIFTMCSRKPRHYKTAPVTDNVIFPSRMREKKVNTNNQKKYINKQIIDHQLIELKSDPSSSFA